VRIVLASRSPRRLELLVAAGVACDVDAVDADETRLAGESPMAYVERVARLKTGAAMARNRGALVIGADTAVVLDDEIVLGKPRDAGDARSMLTRLSGRTHDVLTGVGVGYEDRLISGVERTVVSFRPLTPDDIAWYVASGEPFDKAGGYAIQGWGSRFIPRIEGSYANVVGLPVTRVLAMAAEFGLEIWPDRGSRS
jgi:septum formation protein